MKKKRWVSAVAVVALFAAASVRAESVNYQMVTVGDVGNPDSFGYGSVGYEYAIGKYDVTIGQYTAFLNAVATTDTHSLYSPPLQYGGSVGGITQSGASGNFTYSVLNNGGSSANRPITWVSWFDAARFANWMANGQPTGAQTATTTENGAYDLVNAPAGIAPSKNATNPNTAAAPNYWIPTRNEWYKAASYDPTKGGTGGYWGFATQSDSAPGNNIGSTPNQANYRTGDGYSVTQSSAFDGSQYYLTDVGAFSGSGSHYGTFDQSGNVAQWVDGDGTAGSSRLVLGGNWDNFDAYMLRPLTAELLFSPGYEVHVIGFRLAGASSLTVPEIDPAGLGSVLALLGGALGLLERRRPMRGCRHAVGRRVGSRPGRRAWVLTLVTLFAAASVRAESVNYQMVTVGDVGNPNDSNGLGAVAYEYAIGKYDVTIGQYTAFLNAVATTDTHGLYDASMGTNLNVAGISRAGTSGNYTYAVMVNGGSSANRPITFVDWFDSARFANWMANGQPSGAQSGATTENGAYALGGAVSGPAPGVNATNPNTLAAPTFWIPTENEWYKSAYYQPVASGGPGDGYWTYATRSDSLPGNVIGSEANQVNWRAAWLFSVTQSNAEWGGQYYITDVGAFVGSASYYGTFDQTGNVIQWTDADRTNGFRLLRGSSWYDNPEVPFRLSSSYRVWAETSYAGSGTGFRLAGSSASSSVPEIDPAGLGPVLALLAGALGLVGQRRPMKA